MDDPAWSWPFWKFGLKKDDLFSKLHDQYNTVPSPIQDPEAFHHDVYEISTEASSADEFHRLMADRKALRLRELNDLLESASLEIITNPALIGTGQWSHALQLFRTKSLDSLVRYFASYLPETHPWHHGSDPDTPSWQICAHSHTSSSFFGDSEDEHSLTHEPLSISTSIPPQLPPSPRSMTMRSDSSAASPVDCTHHEYILNTLTPARTLSFSDSEADHLSSLKDSCPTLHDDDTSQDSDPESLTTSVSDLDDLDDSQGKELITEVVHDETVYDEYISIAQMPMEPMDSEVPTPKPTLPSAPATSFFDTRLSSLRRRSVSPSRTHPHHTLSHDSHARPQRSLRMQRRDCSPDSGRRRRTPVDSASRIQKPLSDAMRTRPRGRRGADG